MIVALTGGSGGAKLVRGLAAEMAPAELTVVCNTADDAVFHGLHVSPDIDTLTYTLAGLIDEERGWGLAGESFTVLAQLGRLGEEVWFKLGDKDLATHIARTRLLREGIALSEVTRRIRAALGVETTILPMTDDPVVTRMVTPHGELAFQEYFVRERWLPEVRRIYFAGAEESRAAPGVLESIREAAGVILCPSNPVTSIGPILAIPEIRRALVEAKCTIAGVSPIIGGTSVSGPAHRLMTVVGLEPSAVGVARAYSDFLDTLVVAGEDAHLRGRIEQLGVTPVSAQIRMSTLADKRGLARLLLSLF